MDESQNQAIDQAFNITQEGWRETSTENRVLKSVIVDQKAAHEKEMGEKDAVITSLRQQLAAFHQDGGLVIAFDGDADLNESLNVEPN
jgi:hypothetical protein